MPKKLPQVSGEHSRAAESSGTPTGSERLGDVATQEVPATTAQRLGQELKAHRKRIQRGEIREGDFEYITLQAAEKILLQGETGRPIVEYPTLRDNADHSITAHVERVVSSGERLTAEAQAAIEARFAEKFLELSQLLKKEELTPIEQRRLEKLNRIAQGYDQYRQRLEAEEVGEEAAIAKEVPDDAVVAETLELIAEPPTPTEELAHRPLRTALEAGLTQAAVLGAEPPLTPEGSPVAGDKKADTEDPLAEQREAILKRFEKPGSLTETEAKSLSDEELRLVMTVKEQQRAQLDPDETKLGKEGLTAVVATTEDWAVAAREYRERLHTKSVPAWSSADEREHWTGKNSRVGARKKHSYPGIPEGTQAGEEERITALLEHFKDDGSVYAKEDARGLSDADIKILLRFKDKERQTLDPDKLVATDPKFRHMADGNMRDYLILLEEYRGRHKLPKPKPSPEPVHPPESTPVPTEPVPKPAEPVPTSPEPPAPEKPGRRKVGIVDITAKIDEIARHRAEERLQRELHGDNGEAKDSKAPWWKKLGQGIARQARKSIRHTGEEYYRQKYIQEETRRIYESINAVHPNAFAPDGTVAEFNAEARAIVDRFIHEYDGLVRTEEGEQKIELTDVAPKEALRDLVVRYANKEIDEAAFQTERDTIFTQLQTAHPEIFEQEQATVDNLLDIAREFRVAAEHGEKIAAIDVQLDVELGQARSAIKDEAHLRSFDRLVKTMQKTPILRNMANPVVLGLAVSLAMAPARTLMNQGSKFAQIAGPLAAMGVGAGFAAMRKSTELKGDVSHTRRGLAMGYDIPAGSKRLEKMAEFAYDQKNATALSGQIGTAMEHVRSLAPGDPKYQDALESLMETIAETDARVEYGDSSKHDYIKYSGATKIEQERFALLRTLAEAKKEFAKHLPGLPTGTIGVSEAALEGVKARHIDTLGASVKEQDKAFGKFKNKEVTKAALYGAATGLVVGSAVQWGARALQEALPHHDPDAPQSAIAKLWDVMHHRQETVPTEEHSYGIGDHGRLVLPEDWRAVPANVPDQPNLVNIFDEHGRAIADHPIEIDPNNGHFNPEDLEAMRKAGAIIAERDVHEIAGGHATQTVEEFAKDHDGMTNIARGGGSEHAGPHFDQDTPTEFDQNELRFDMGGVNNTGIDETGKYVMNVARMTAEGAFKGAEQVDIHQLIASGDANVLLSLSQETQKMVFKIPIDANGDIHIDPHSEIGKLLFQNDNGHLKFLGRFAEVARNVHNEDGSLMIDANGDQHVQILSTYEGQGIDQVPVTDSVRHITSFEQPRDWEGPWVMPLAKRNPLESFVPRHFRPEYFTTSDEQRAQWEKDRSPRLRENPDARLDMQEETNWYFQEQENRYGSEYIQELDGSIDGDEELRALDPNTEIIVCMPVAAAHEAKNIYSTLELYAAQHPETLETTTILLNLNWIEAADQEQIDTTIREVARARKDFPQLRLATMTKAWPTEWVKSRNGKIYGEVVKSLNDTALRAIQRSGITRDVYLLTNDADARGMSISYLRALQRDIHERSEADGFLGKIEWGTESYDKYPGYHVAARVMQVLDSMYRHGVSQHRSVPSSGANFLIKAGAYAAVGGYDRTRGAGVDTDLGRRIKAARFGNRQELSDEQYPIKYTNAAWIDTDLSRALEYYRSGRPIIDMWGGFDEGGYQPRGELVVSGTEENLEEDFGTIVQRVEFQISSLIEDWVGYENVETYTTGLNYVLIPQAGKPSWEIQEDDGKKHVVLTDQGKAWLKQQLIIYRDQSRKDTLYRKRGRRAGQVKNPPAKPSPRRVKVSSTDGISESTIEKNPEEVMSQVESEESSEESVLSPTPEEEKAPTAEIMTETLETPIDAKALRSALVAQNIPEQWLPNDDRDLVMSYRTIRKEAAAGDVTTLRDAIRKNLGVPKLVLNMYKDVDLIAKFEAVEKAITTETT